MPRQARLDAAGIVHVLDHYSKVLRNYATDILIHRLRRLPQYDFPNLRGEHGLPQLNTLRCPYREFHGVNPSTIF